MKTKPSVQAVPLCLVLFIDGIGLGLLFPIFSVLFLNHDSALLPYDYSDHHRTFLFGLACGIFMICWFFGASIVGDLSDALGRKKSLFICLMGAGLGYGLTAIAIDIHSITLIIIGRMVAGLTAGSQPVAQAAIVDIAPKDKVSMYLNYVLLALCLGFMIGPLLGGILSNPNWFHGFSMSTPLWFAACLALGNLFLLNKLYHEKPFPHRAVNIQLSRPFSLFLDAFRSDTIRSLSIIYICFQVAWALIYSYLSIFGIKKFSMGVAQTSYMMAFLGLGFALGMSGLLQWVMKPLSVKNMVVLNWMITTVLIVGVLLAHTVGMMFCLLVLTGATLGASYGNIVALFSQQVAADRQGWIMGITGAIGALAFGIVELTTTDLLSFGYATPIACGCVLLCVAGMSLLFWKPKQR
jgi:DHA1 family tetracycline resistance protein-like MFS transporter